MPFKKGVSGNPNGRPAGSPNRVTATVKETIANVFDKMQDDDETSLETWAKNNVDDFYKVVALKMLPIQLGNDPESPLTNSEGFTDAQVDKLISEIKMNVREQK